MPQTVVFIAAAAVMYTVQPCALAVHLYCSAWVNSAFHPLWAGNMSISLWAESTGKIIRAVGFEYGIRTLLGRSGIQFAEGLKVGFMIFNSHHKVVIIMTKIVLLRFF